MLLNPLVANRIKDEYHMLEDKVSFGLFVVTICFFCYLIFL